MPGLALRMPFEGNFPITNDFQAHLSYSKAPGIDFGLPPGTQVLAAAAGRVVYSEWSDRGGRYVMVDHGQHRYTLYSHLQAVWRVKGEAVAIGDVLGLSGDTGWTTGPHLHFGVKMRGKWRDPMLYLPQ